MKKRILFIALAASVVAVALVATAVARKVANPGPIAITSETGTMRVGSESFGFDSSTQITFNGSITGAGVVTIPAANVVFPDQFVRRRGSSSASGSRRTTTRAARSTRSRASRR